MASSHNPIPEEYAATIFSKAIQEGKAADLLLTLFEGGSVTIEEPSGNLVIISANLINQMLDEIK